MLGGVGMGDSLSFVFFIGVGMYVVVIFGGDSLGFGRGILRFSGLSFFDCGFCFYAREFLWE